MDILNEFVLEHGKSINELDIHNYAVAASHVVTEGAVTALYANNLIAVDPTLYTDYLNKTIQNMDTITANSEELDTFFSKTYTSLPLSNKKITIPMHSEEDISKIRPDYLMTYAQEADTLIKKIFNGTETLETIKKKLTNPEFVNKYKKQLVRTTVVVNDTRDLMVLDSPSLVVVDSIYIEHNLIPFVRTYPTNVDSLKNISFNCINMMSASARALNNTFAGANTVIKSGKVSGNMIRAVEYAMSMIHRLFLNLCAYISGMLIRKMSYYSYNIKSCLNLYNVIHASFPEMDRILHESVLDGKLGDIDDSDLFYSAVDGGLDIIKPHIQAAVGMKLNELTTMLADKYGRKVDDLNNSSIGLAPYSKSPYEKVNNTFVDISRMLHTFETEIRGEDFVIDDVLTKSGLDETFISKFSGVLAEFEDTSNYVAEPSMDTVLSLVNEVSHYEENIDSIVTNMGTINKYLETYSELIDDSVNLYDNATHKELVSVVETITGNYKDYVLFVSKKIISRLDNLTDALEDDDVNVYQYETESADEKVTDYEAELLYNEYAQNEQAAKAIMESINHEFQAAVSKSNRGLNIVFEADNNAQTGANTNNNSGTPNTTTGGAEVKSDNATANNTTTTANTNNNNPSNSSKKVKTPEEKQSLIDRIVKAFTELMEKIFGKSDAKAKRVTTYFNYWMNMSNEKTKNKTLKDFMLNNLDYSGRYLELYACEKFNAPNPDVIQDIQTVTTKIKSINPSALPEEFKNNPTEDAIIKYLFPMIPAKKPPLAKDNSFGQRVRGFYINGKTDVKIAVHGADNVKSSITKMIDFCSQYTPWKQSIDSALNNLKDAAASTATNLINNDASAEVKTDEANTEGNNNNGKNNKKNNSANINTIITNLTGKYISAVLSVIEIKHTQYMTFIKAFANEYIPYSEAKAAINEKRNGQNENNNEGNTENTEGNNNGGNNANNNGNNNNNNG